MKKTILFLSITLLLGTVSFGQNASVDEVFKKYALKEGFTTVNISDELFKMFNDDEDLDDIGIGNIKILAVEDSTLNAKLDFYDDIVPELNMDDYKRLLTVNDGEDKVIMMTKKKNRGKQESLMIVGGSDNAIIYIEGNLNLSEISEIAEVIDSATASINNDSE